MATYRHGQWTQWDGLEFYCIEKKTWYGWKEITWWHKNEKGKKAMDNAVKRLVKAGNTVF